MDSANHRSKLKIRLLREPLHHHSFWVIMDELSNNGAVFKQHIHVIRRSQRGVIGCNVHTVYVICSK